jgi:protease PrsW
MFYALSVLPALLMWEYAAVKVNFRLDRTSRRRLFRVGMVVALGAIVLEMPISLIVAGLRLGPLGSQAVKAVLVGLIEEGVDYAGLVYLADRRQMGAIGPAAAIPLATGIALGFAVLENIGYLIGAAAHGSELAVGVLRAFTAIPEHALDGMAMGAFYCLAWQSRRGVDRRALAAALLVPVVMHAAYDFTAMSTALPGHPRWATYGFPFLLLAEGLLTAALVAIAQHGPAAISSRVSASDLEGRRAITMGLIFLVLGNGLIYLALRSSYPAQVTAIAAAPMVLGFDLGLLGLKRRSEA